MNSTLRAAALCCALGAMLVAGARTITVKTPGTLARKVGSKNLYTTEELKIKGALNAADVRTLRMMAGCDSADKPTPGRLRHIDLRDVSFVPGPESTWQRGYPIKSRHALPDVFLYNCKRLESIVLPAKLDSIKSYALASTHLRELYVPDGVVVSSSAFNMDSLLRTLRLPDMPSLSTPSRSGIVGLRSIRFGNTDYIGGQSFVDMPDLEEVIIDGALGHIDGYTFTNLPKLKRIIFNGPIGSTGGAQFVHNCPELEQVVFNGLVLYSGFGAPQKCPKLEGYTVNGLVLAGDSTVFPIASAADVAARPEMKEQVGRLAKIYERIVADDNANTSLIGFSLNYSVELGRLAQEVGLTQVAEQLTAATKPLRDELDKPKLQILKETLPYESGAKAIEWTYAQPSDSVLALDRAYFNLDSIAGMGDDVSRIRNLTYWVHDAVRHDGSSYNPQSQSLIDIYELCKKEDRGVNCRMMAIMLTEALLAEGIPARYLTCQPKYWQYDSDCHVICIAWSDSLGKWIWADPTFAAFVADENGTPLHPGEVRQRLIEDKPLVLNPDANWNHQAPQSKEDYLDNYMAKNLYYITARVHNGARPEGSGSDYRDYILLAPANSKNMPGHNRAVADPAVFWAPPTPAPASTAKD